MRSRSLSTCLLLVRQGSVIGFDTPIIYLYRTLSAPAVIRTVYGWEKGTVDLISKVTPDAEGVSSRATHRSATSSLQVRVMPGLKTTHRAFFAACNTVSKHERKGASHAGLYDTPGPQTPSIACMREEEQAALVYMTRRDLTS